MQVRGLAARTVVPLVLALGLVGCGGDGDTAGEVDPAGTVRIEIAEPQHLLPTQTVETSGSQVLSALFSPLVDYDAQNKPYEVAAESVTSADNRVWTVRLKPGYTFHNGEPVTADNYLDAWNDGAYGPIPLRHGQHVYGHSEKVRHVEMDLFDRVDLLRIEVLR